MSTADRDKWGLIYQGGRILYPRPARSPCGRVDTIHLPACRCDRRQGPPGGCCGNCGLAIPWHGEARPPLEEI